MPACHTAAGGGSSRPTSRPVSRPASRPPSVPPVEEEEEYADPEADPEERMRKAAAPEWALGIAVESSRSLGWDLIETYRKQRREKQVECGGAVAMSWGWAR